MTEPVADIPIAADPEPAPIDLSAVNAELRQRFGAASNGWAYFRAVWCGEETIPWQGRRAMKYPSRTEHVEPEATYFVRTPGGLVAVPLDPADYPEELAAYRTALVHVEVVLRQKGEPCYAIEGWMPGNRVGAGWDEATLGPVPEQGDYVLLWFCRDERGEPRDPGVEDIEELARRIALFEADPLSRGKRWDSEFDPDEFNARLERRLARDQAKRDAEGDRFEDEVREHLRDYFQTIARTSTSG